MSNVTPQSVKRTPEMEPLCPNCINLMTKLNEERARVSGHKEHIGRQLSDVWDLLHALTDITFAPYGDRHAVSFTYRNARHHFHGEDQEDALACALNFLRSIGAIMENRD